MTKEQHLVSIIIPNYNYAHLIIETLESVMAQTYPHFECIIVDDGSTDNSVEVIQEFIKNDHRFSLLQKTNGGLPSTRNEGMKLAKGDFIAFLDADDLWTVDKLKNQLEIIEKTNCDVVFSNALIFSENGKVKEELFDQSSELTVYSFLAGNPIPGCSSSFMFSKESINKVGFFNNDLRSAEDLDFLFRASLLNVSFSYSPSIDVMLRKHANSMQLNYLRMYLNKLYCFDRSYDALLHSSIVLDKEKLKNALLVRFQSMVWTARDAKREDLIRYCYLRTKQLIGWKFYFTNVFWSNYTYDVKMKISKVKKRIFTKN